MRKKNIIFGVIGFVLAVVTGGQAFAALGPGEISMGVFSIPLPGCAPEVTISDEKDANDCYTMTIQNKTLQNGVCSSFGIEPIPKKVCDGKDGAGGGDGIIDDVQGVYVPYPQSKGTCSGGTCQYPDRQGYLTTTVSFTDDARQPVVTISLDPCEVFYDETDDNKPKKKCTAQGNATAWLNSDGTGNYEANESYIFEISDPATTLDSGVDPNPYYEYVEPTKNDASGWFENPGHTVKVTVFVNGQQKREFHAVDRCDKYKNSSDPSAEAVVKCMVGEPGKTPGYIAGETKYCLNINPTLCGNYDSLVDDGVCAGAGDDASRTVRSTTTEYYGPSGNSNSTSRNVGYVATTQVMCSNDSDDDITATHNDPCTPASNPTVTCASGYTWQTCTNQTKTSQTYTGCFPSNLGQLFAYKDEIVPPNFASDGTNLYYCQVEDCDNTAACWIDGNKANGPNPNGKLNGTNCWGVVSIDGLQGDAGPGCSFAYYNNQWQVCCLPVDASGNVNVNGSWSCKEVTDTGILNQLNNWMCKPTYTTKYINKKGDGTYEYKSTTDNERTAATVGIRTTITNCDGTNGGDVDVFDGPAGDDYDPCDGLSDTEALNTVSRRTTVYVHHGSTDSSTTTTGIGYYTETNVMCDTSGNKIVKKYDKCDPVSLASGASRTVGGKTCSGNQTLLMCTPQEEPTTPYYVCSDAEVSNYPQLVYVAPTVSDGKFTARGYTKRVHKYTSDGAEVDGAERHNPDECHTVYKRTFDIGTNDDTGVRTATTTTQSTLKCRVQNPGTTGWSVGTEYCLNTTNDASTSCNGYSENTSDVITSTLRYHLPIMGTGSDNNKPKEPGYTYDAEVPSGQSETLRITNRKLDKCETLLTRTNSGTGTVSSSVTKCTVGAPTGTPGLASPYTAEATYCLGYANGTCPGGLIDIGSAIDDAAENDPCAEISGTDNLAKAVKKVVSRTYTRSANSQGALTSVYKMCDNTDHTESTADECKEVPTPAGQTCTNGVWMQCTRQADEGAATATARGTTYGYCAVYPQCVGNTGSSSIVKKTQRSYTAPTKTNNGDAYYTTPGKVTDVKIACNDSTISTEESSEDECQEVPLNTFACPDGKPVRKQCKRQGKEGTNNAGTIYNICTTGTSIFSTISDNDPCGGDTTSSDAKKKVKNIRYEYVAASGSGTVGYTKKITSMCNSLESDKEEYIYDTCISVSAASGCNGANDKNYKCYNQTKLTSSNATEREYNVCNPSSNVSSVALADSVKAQSLFEIWKDQYKDLNNTSCSALFGAGKTCSASGNNLNESDMLANMNAYGVWKTDQVVTKNQTDSSNLTFEKYQQSLQPCQRFNISEDAGYDGSQGAGKRYTMTCVE